MLRSNITCYLIGLAFLIVGAPVVHASDTVKNSSPVVSVSQAAQKLRQETAYKLLRAGQVALKNNQLTTPAHANALDLFKSVLTLSPDNEIAKSGIQSVLIRYAMLIRNSLQHGNIQVASRYLKTAKQHFPNNPLLNELTSQIAKEQSLITKTQSAPASLDNDNVIRLNPLWLNKKNTDIKAQLTAIGERLVQTKEGVLIYARSDKEGRWLYKQINRAAKNYRVRGDIKLSKKPRLIIEPPY